MIVVAVVGIAAICVIGAACEVKKKRTTSSQSDAEGVFAS